MAVTLVTKWAAYIALEEMHFSEEKKTLRFSEFSE